MRQSPGCSTAYRRLLLIAATMPLMATTCAERSLTFLLNTDFLEDLLEDLDDRSNAEKADDILNDIDDLFDDVF